ncbi:uncharacterized protein LOC110236905 [Exaiptasia diaphana]|uniref:Beta/gamma crystallin 'Greek key' domain-containing protein n=1 Tax=Exaiptasia diaphana TaxID=2652724 RepID=A0A913X303_EXADI|nr:uncharacterized protein LOC110236905 [Exaiptasia diaphana]KXJ15785.1 hypothetical protein AC249_AIPGENE8665 [Exaiptasia diaphana]
MAQHNITLFDADGLSYKFEGSSNKTDDVNYVKITVTGGIWILYRNVDFNASQAGGNASDILIFKEPVSELKLDFSPCSLFRCQDNVDSCTVFEHNNYGGQSKQYQEACFDICQDFPSGDPRGVSSIILWPNKDWELFTKENFTGGSKVVKNSWHPNPESMGFPNDKLRSLRPR